MEARCAVATETFRGEHYLKVDTKGRVMLPAPFRHIFETMEPALAGKGFALLLVYGGSNRAYVEGYTAAGAEEINTYIKNLEFGSPEQDLASAIYIEQSVSVETDKDGRFSLPPQVRDKLNLARDEVELAFVGTRNAFRIFRADVYRANRKAEIQELEAKLLQGADPRTLFKSPMKGA